SRSSALPIVRIGERDLLHCIRDLGEKGSQGPKIDLKKGVGFHVVPNQDGSAKLKAKFSAMKTVYEGEEAQDDQENQEGFISNPEESVDGKDEHPQGKNRIPKRGDKIVDPS